MSSTTLRRAALAAALVAPTAGAANLQAQSSGPGYVVSGGVVQPVNHLPNPYETVRDFGMLPDGRSWGSVSALQVDSDGRHIWVADRCGANDCVGSPLNPIVKLDPQGRTVAHFGAGLIAWPHGMHVDPEGNVWVTDARGANAEELQEFPGYARGHAVYKFSPTGELLMTLGTPGTRGDGTGALLAEPNDVITAPDGSIFVAEAHTGQGRPDGTPGMVARIVKFSPDGRVIKSWGSFGSGPQQFKTPHALAFDSQGRLFVADRGNNSLKIFDQEGNFIDEWKQFSRISGLHIDTDDTLYAIDSESSPDNNPGWRKGLRVGSARTGDVWYYVPQHDSERASGGGGFGAMGEGVTVDAQGNVYAGEVGPVVGVTKFVPRLVNP